MPASFNVSAPFLLLSNTYFLLVINENVTAANHDNAVAASYETPIHRKIVYEIQSTPVVKTPKICMQ